MDELGPIVIDPHAYERLWPALAVWLLLFATAGDGWMLLRRQCALAFGAPAQAVVTGKRRLPAPVFRAARRDYLQLDYEWHRSTRQSVEAVGAAGWKTAAVGTRRPVHVLAGAAFLDDDFGYSRWKLWVFGASLAALWAWAAARRRYG